jgi:hypothetical protein
LVKLSKRWYFCRAWIRRGASTWRSCSWLTSRTPPAAADPSTPPAAAAAAPNQAIKACSAEISDLVFNT